MIILGISAFYHDSAAALIIDGVIVAAAQEERFTRLKHDPAFPKNSIEYCLKNSQLRITDVDSIVYYDKPFLTFERSIETFIAEAPFGFISYITSIAKLVKNRLLLKTILLKDINSLDDNLSKEDKKRLRSIIHFCEHHLSHAASAFYPSQFEKALVLTIDGVGEWATTTLAIGNGRNLSIEKEIHFPHSIGLLYSAFTYYLGFKVNSGEYKVMGLAPYGKDKYSQIITNNIIDIKDDGSFNLDMSYFSFTKNNRMINKKFEALLNAPRRLPESELRQFHFDVAKSIQVVIEEVILKMCSSLANEYNIKNLCLAGGVALNCVVNGKINDSKIFDNIWIQPAAGDAGGAIGCALALHHLEFNSERTIDTNLPDGMSNSILGPQDILNDTRKLLIEKKVIFTEYTNRDQLNNDIANKLNEGSIVGWHQGKMEFGPRALGNRSIIADPRSKSMQKDLNLKIKFRESFRPFAPSILEEHAKNYFDLSGTSPYMLFVAQISNSKRLELGESDLNKVGLDKLSSERSIIPAVTHVDNSARVQTVSKESNPAYHSLISSFYKITGCPILINTSFNVRGEPIVCTAYDSLNCFMNTNIDILVIENFVISKINQNEKIIFEKKAFHND
jgi:carbamoyltransferase